MKIYYMIYKHTKFNLITITLMHINGIQVCIDLNTNIILH